MQLRFVVPMLLAVGLFLVACQDGAQGGPSLAVVDMARVMRDSAPGKEGVKFLESRQTALQEQLDAIQDKLEKNPADEAAVAELQRVYAVSQQRMQAEQQNVVNILFDTIQRVLNEYCEKNGYDAILGSEAAAAFNPKIDVTNAIIAEVDKQKVEFKPVPEARAPEGAEPAEKDAAAQKDEAAQKNDAANAPAKKDDAASAQPKPEAGKK